jgi:hypothetical protein
LVPAAREDAGTPLLFCDFAFAARLTDMPQRRKHRFWRLLRIYFRRFRIAVWTCILLVLAMLIYLNQIGLPGFAKKPLLEKLRARGVDLQFSRLRLRWPQGLVAEHVRFGQVAEGLHPEVTAAEVQVQLDYRALAHLRLQVDSLRLRRGTVVFPVPDATQTNREISVRDIQTDLQLLPGDQWELEHFTAGFAGARIQLSGAITNASAVREWSFLQPEKTPAVGRWQDRLRAFADTLDKIKFSVPPDFRMDVRGDARDLLSFQVRLLLNTPSAETPWGSVDDGKFVVRLFPSTSNEVSRLQVHLEAADGMTEWASTTNLDLNLQVVSLPAETNHVNCELAVSAGTVDTKWAQATNVQFGAHWIHTFTNPIPMNGDGHLLCENLQTRWCSAREVSLKGQLGEWTGPVPATDSSWAWWAGLAPYPLDVQIRVRDFQRDGLLITSLDGNGRWRGPDLALTNLHADLYDGNLDLNADLNASTRKLAARLRSDVDPHRVEAVLTPLARQWLSRFTWTAPPIVEGSISFTLPAWTNSNPDWRAEVQPILQIAGHFDVPKGGTFRGVPASSASSSFVYSNMTWRLPDLVAIRPEGRLEAEHISNDRSKNFYWRVRSTIDPLAARPLVESNVLRGLNLFTFARPPLVEAELWGRWHDEEKTGMKGRVILTNFTFRGQQIDSLQTAVTYTNRMLAFAKPEAHRGSQLYKADSVIVDFRRQQVYLTNGFSTGDPMVVARAIGPHVVRAIEPYQFLNPPTAYVHGVIPMARDEDADLYFRLAGGPFKWWKFKVKHISGEVHWYGRLLNITDIDADFYGGKLNGSVGFKFIDSRGTEYHFATAATNVLLQALMADLSTRSNQLEGTLDTRLVVRRGNLARKNDFDGSGSVSLRDGLIWNIPIFGVFSAPLDKVVPGLGSSRARNADGTFSITNGVIFSDDAEIRSPAMRLLYRGAADIDGNVNATVEAQVLRDVFLIGPIVSTVLWPFAKMFEYRVTGTLAQPHTELLYFGKSGGSPVPPNYPFDPTEKGFTGQPPAKGP